MNINQRDQLGKGDYKRWALMGILRGRDIKGVSLEVGEGGGRSVSY